MSLHDDQVSLQQMLDSARKVLYLAARRSRPDLDDDWVATLALMQLLQIIGEAARRLSASTRQQHPHVRWARFIGLRNRLIHGYDTIDLDRLWEVLTVDIPELAANLERILAARS